GRQDRQLVIPAAFEVALGQVGRRDQAVGCELTAVTPVDAFAAVQPLEAERLHRRLVLERARCAALPGASIEIVIVLEAAMVRADLYPALREVAPVVREQQRGFAVIRLGKVRKTGIGAGP